MSSCEMCGAQNASKQILLEGSTLRVCKLCTSYGKEIEPKTVTYAKSKVRPASSVMLVSDYAARIKRAREKRNLSQTQLARALAEKESVISHVESNQQRPSEKLARKLERFLNITLYETQKAEAIIPKTTKGEGLTVGDLIKFKR